MRRTADSPRDSSLFLATRSLVCPECAGARLNPERFAYVALFPVTTLGYIAWRPGARIGGSIRAFFDAVDLSVEAADGAERHRNLLREWLPRNSDTLPWPTYQPRVRMSLR